MNEKFKVTTNEEAWNNLQTAKNNLWEELMKPEVPNAEYVKINMKMIDEVQYYLCPDKEQNEP